MKHEFKLNGESILKETIRKGTQSLDVKDTGVAVFTDVVNERVKSLQDLLRVANIDPLVWKVKRWICNKWEVASKLGDKEMKVQDLWQVKAWLESNQEAIQIQTIKAEVISEMKKFSPKYPKLVFKKLTDPHLLVIDIPDLHLDKLAWGKETGSDWDIKISSSLFLKMVNDLLMKSSSYQIERILFPVGNDFFNADNLLNTTTGGTPQQVDSRWKKAFLTGKKLLITAIDTLQTIAPVDIIVIPGNHDKQRAWYLGDTLESWYHNCKAVNVDNSPSQRKYYRYGENLLGYAHGKEEKVDRLPMILANEAKSLFSETKFHEWHLGDKHHKRDIKFFPATETDGIIIRFLSSLSPADIWHYEKGYLAKRAAQGFVYSKTLGWVCQFNSYVHEI